MLLENKSPVPVQKRWQICEIMMTNIFDQLHTIYKAVLNSSLLFELGFSVGEIYWKSTDINQQRK